MLPMEMTEIRLGRPKHQTQEDRRPESSEQDGSRLAPPIRQSSWNADKDQGTYDAAVEGPIVRALLHDYLMDGVGQKKRA